MIRAESPARVEADPARDQPLHAPPTPQPHAQGRLGLEPGS